jgi:hypothetical protein
MPRHPPDRPSRDAKTARPHPRRSAPRPDQPGAQPDRLLAADLDLAAGRLAVRRDGRRRRTVYLDELTSSLAAEWLRERRRRWPRTGNPHLLITRVTASEEHHPSVAHTVIEAFTPLGLTAGQRRRDRILDEASHTADPVHLMSVFGISAKSAMAYIQAAHPERRPTRPR